MKRLVSILSAIALASAGLIATTSVPAQAAGITATIADSTAQTQWPYDMYSLGGKIVFQGKIPATGNYGLAYLDGTSTVAVDMSSIPDFQNIDSVFGMVDGVLYLGVYTNNGGPFSYAYNGTTFTEVPDLDANNNDLSDGVEWNGAWYFQQSSYLTKLDNGVISRVFFGDPNNPDTIRNAEPRGVFNGKLYVDGYPDANTWDRFLLEIDANGFRKVTATIDYQGTPTLRAFSYVSHVFVANNKMYFGANYEAPDEFDTYWNGSNGDRGMFQMDSTGTVTRLEPTSDDPFTGNKTFTSVAEGFKAFGSNVVFQSCIMGTNACELYKIVGNNITYVAAYQGMRLESAVVFNNKLYFGSNGAYVGGLADSNSQTSAPQIGYYDANFNYTTFSADISNRNSSLILYGNGLIYPKADANPRTKDNMWFTDGTTEVQIEGIQDYDISEYIKEGSKLYLLGVLPTDADPGTGRLFVIDGASAVVPTPTPVDTDNPDLGSLTETKTFKGTKGSIVFPDGSGIEIDAKGRIFSKVKSKYLTSIAGSIVATYTQAGKSKSFTCKVKTYGSTKKLSKLPRNAILYKSKQACQLPAAAIASLKLGKLTIVQKITVKRYYATTGLAVDKVTKKKIKAMARKMTIKFTK